MKNKLNQIFSSLILVILLTSLASSVSNPGTQYNEYSINNYNEYADNYEDSYIIGDADGNGAIEEADVHYLIAYIFSGGPEPVPYEAGDHNQDGTVNISDAVSLINYLVEQGIIIPPVQDTTAPIITLLEPDHEDVIKTTEDDKKVTFEYKVTDDSEIEYCELIIDGDVEKTDTTIERDKTQKFSKTLDTGTYEFKIRCYDIHGNYATSDENDFKIKKESTSSNNENYQNQNTNNNDNSEFYFPEQETIDLNPETQEGINFNLSIGLIVPIILGLLIITFFIIIIVILASRKENYQY